MPLLSVETLDDSAGTRLALWRITETADELFGRVSLSEQERNNLLLRYKSPSRQREILAVKALLHRLFGQDAPLRHNADGRPLLPNGCNVSISHTKGWAAVIVSRGDDVAVDIEHVSPRVLKVKRAFLRADEQAGTLTSALLHWCAKETLYKLCSAERLTFMDMRVNGITGDGSCGTISAESLRGGGIVNVRYRTTGDFVLTYAHQPVRTKSD